MSEIIDSTYEIIGKLGAGGGGVVYLANHIRLGKKVVLKADKRNINTRTLLLRREVDVLKELRHTYIPQVYDYFIEDNTSYTVMDFVDGESLDKVLKREGKFPQPLVIRWARQLLEALSYLHSPTHGDPPRGYIHSDVKPGNIMLRPNGDICLIDFNISLAIGIENVVGRSDGYSSPEHYGLDYSFSQNDGGDDKTLTLPSDDDKTEVVSTSVSVKSSEMSGSVRKVTVLDARSDIYSVGATLYHLLSGKRPHKDAMGVEPLSYKEFSPLLVDIISKAMNPNPDLRFHTADEMLNAINDLWKNDSRVKRQKKQIIIASALLSTMLIAGCFTVFTGMRQMERHRTAQVMASNSSEALSRGDVEGALNYALEALVDEPGIFDIPYTAEAQLALTNALGVYDLSDCFKPCYTIELPASPFRIMKSPDETMLLVCCAYDLSIYEIESGKLIKTLPMLESALCNVEFTDDTVIVYAGKNGITAYNIASDTVLWQADATTAITVSDDRSVVAAINRTADIINFYDAKSGKFISSRDLDGRHLNIPENDKFADSARDVFELSGDGEMCAVSLNEGYLGLIDVYDSDNDLIIYESSDYTYFDGGFIGEKFAFSAAGAPGAIFGIIDYETGEYLGDMAGNAVFGIETYNGKLYVTLNDTIVEFDINNFNQKEIAYTENKNINAFDISDNYAIAATDDDFSVFFSGAGLLQTESCKAAQDFVVITDSYAVLANRNTPAIEVLRLKNYDDLNLICYDPQIKHSEARLKSDRSSAMLFDVNGFNIINIDGSVRAEGQFAEPEKIYDQQYCREGDYLEVTYYNGRVVCYSADSGEVISETSAAPPDDSLDEEFETENYIITAPLHGTPTVYDKVNGNKITELKSEDYLTYITELDDYIIAQYISAEGTYYGILMNKDCETIAYMPYLCDICNGMLIYDFPSGSIRFSPVYELHKLKKMAEDYRD